MPNIPAPPELAVIVPAFKTDFLARTLQSLLQQTNQRFNIYVFDDAGPAEIQSIVRSVLGARHHTYMRFEANLGRRSLAKHWNRCVAATQEPWVWLFSDDDLLDQGCVEAFYSVLKGEGETADILRFDGWIVDEHDRTVALLPPNLDRESWLQFAFCFLMGWRYCVQQQLVFRRAAFDRIGGFFDLPLGWTMDNAAVIALGRQSAIRRIPGPRVLWRQSQKNITPDRSIKVRENKIRAFCWFLQWLRDQLETPREHLFEGDDAAFSREMERCLVEEIGRMGALPSIANWRLLSQTRARVTGGARSTVTKFVASAAVVDFLTCIGRTAKGLAGIGHS
jgi:hypothetical protein